MGVSAVVPHQWLFALGIVFLISSVTVLALNKRQRYAVLERLRVRRRRASGASTPPRSFSPGKEASEGTPSIKESQALCPDYIRTFPPSRRCALPELSESAMLLNKETLIGPEPSTEFMLDHSLPTTRSYDIESDIPRYTPTGFSTDEVKSMGDFPAYDILSGVPLPRPYSNFEPAKAVPRPYRPFRWAYHQTMCKFNIVLLWQRLMNQQH